MNRIDKCFSDLKSRNEKALVCFLTCGDPDFATTEKLVNKIVKSGADIVELGIPFSDPLADGPTIQASSFRALEAGATVKGVLATVKAIRQNCDAPIVLMSYFNPIRKYGIDQFVKDATAAGADGVIMTDLPIEEAGDWKIAADAANLATVFLLAPTSTKERIAATAKFSSGFIYCVSRTGVTGAQNELPIELKSLVDTIKGASDLPVVVGFGISTREHVKQVMQYADGAVVGSALVNIISKSANSDDAVTRAGEFVGGLH